MYDPVTVSDFLSVALIWAPISVKTFIKNSLPDLPTRVVLHALRIIYLLFITTCNFIFQEKFYLCPISGSIGGPTI